MNRRKFLANLIVIPALPGAATALATRDIGAWERKNSELLRSSDLRLAEAKLIAEKMVADLRASSAAALANMKSWVT